MTFNHQTLFWQIFGRCFFRVSVQVFVFSQGKIRFVILSCFVYSKYIGHACYTLAATIIAMQLQNFLEVQKHLERDKKDSAVNKCNNLYL